MKRTIAASLMALGGAAILVAPLAPFTGGHVGHSIQFAVSGAAMILSGHTVRQVIP